MVEDCCCDYETVDAINEEVLHPILQELVKLPFFRYFKVSTSGLFVFQRRGL
jgi:ERO1-like protein alpha